MNVNQLYDIINTHLLYHYAKLDKRYATLCVLVKAWAEAKQIADTVNGSFSGYTLNLLVLHYLMCATVPAVLPNLQQKYVPVVGNERKKWKKKKDAERSESDPPSTKPTKEPEVNKKSVGYLLMGFFDYYSHFDFANQAVCITHGCCVARESLPHLSSRDPIIIMDPYEPLNFARASIQSRLKRSSESYARQGKLSFLYRRHLVLGTLAWRCRTRTALPPGSSRRERKERSRRHINPERAA